MANFQQETVMADERERSQRKNLHQPFGMVSQSVSSDSEQSNFLYQGMNRQITIIHPFNSATSWIRAIPEKGTQYVGAFRSDESKPQPLVNVTRNSLERNDQYRQGANLYRPLVSGELDIASTGLASAYFSRRSMFDMRGGILTRYADQDKLITGDRAPTHQKQLYQYRSNDLGDEERLGIVSRPKKLDTGALSTWELSFPKIEDNFIAEHYLSIKNPSGVNPFVLFTNQKGHVVDIEGKQTKQTKTQIPLRFFEEYFANDESSTRFEIDEKGNYYIELASAAAEGYQLYVPQGNYVRDIGGNENIVIEKNSEHAIGNSVNYQIGDNWKMTVGKDYYLNSEDGNMSFTMSSKANAGQMIMSTKGHFFILDDTVDKEAIYLMHSKGSQIAIDKKGSIKFGTQDGSIIFMDSDNQSITIASSLGSLITLKDTVSIADNTGKQMISLTDKSINIAANTSVNLSCPAVNFASGSINLGNLASLSVTIAEQLAVLFDSHIHASPTGPTSPPLPPNTAALMNANPITSFASSFIKIRSNLA